MSDNATAVETNTARERRTALVVESDRALRDLLRLHLHNDGFNVILAPDVTIAGRTILQRPQAIDVLVVNAQLPFMSGIEFVSTLIADRSLPFIPTVVIATTDQDASRADILGVPVLVVPFAAQQFIALVQTTLQRPDVKPAPPPGPQPSMRQRLDDLTVPVESMRRSLRIVIADDEPDTVTSLAAILCHEGHSVFGTDHPSQVIPEVRNSKPDAVILDIDMPGISGFAIAREIKEMFGEAAPLLLAVSGKWFGQTDRMLAELAGFDHFLQKPCHPDALLSLVERGPRRGQGSDSYACAPSRILQT